MPLKLSQHFLYDRWKITYLSLWRVGDCIIEIELKQHGEIVDNLNCSTPMTSRSVSHVRYEETFQGHIIHSSETKITEVSTGLPATGSRILKK